MKIALAKASAAKTKEQRNRILTHPEACHATLLPKVAEQNPRVEISLPRVTKGPKADCRMVQIVASPPVPRPVEQAPTIHSQSWSPWVDAQSSAAWPNYISQDEDNNPTPKRCTTRAWSIMQQAMLACNNIKNPTYTISPSQLSHRKFPMTWLYKMVNLVIGAN
jgi:hypothetical protein